jgi:FAD/FMN-containing dehydrogenase
MVTETSTYTVPAQRSGFEEAVAELGSRLRGRLVRPGDDDYDVVRAVWNGMVDRRPVVIVRCAGVADVRAGVAFARRLGLPLAVRGGGHNAAGNAVCDDGVVIDLTDMRAVRVDRATSTVRAEGGATIGDLDRETQEFGLAVPLGVVSETGVAGLTLSGGAGWLRRRHGLSCDALVSADVVTADGDLVTAGGGQHEDLLWALKGGGGNFGVVTSLEYRAVPVGPEVFFAFVVHAGVDARTALQDYRRWAADAPGDVSAFAILWHGPELPEIPVEHHGRPVLICLAVHCGSIAEGERELQALRELGRPVADLSGPMAYLDVQRFFDEDYPAHTMRYYWKSCYLPELSDEAIDRLVVLNEASPSHHSTIDVWQLGGALAQVPEDGTAFGDRSAAFLVGIESNWEDPRDDGACLAWGREVFATLQPFADSRQYLNFPGGYEDAEHVVRSTFGANLDRLVAVKRRYDPGNVFRLNANIDPTW